MQYTKQYTENGWNYDGVTKSLNAQTYTCPLTSAYTIGSVVAPYIINTA